MFKILDFKFSVGLMLSLLYEQNSRKYCPHIEFDENDIQAKKNEHVKKKKKCLIQQHT